MYKTPEEAWAYIAAFLPLVKGHERDDVVLCPTFVCIPAVVEALRASGIGTGGQDLSWETEGPYTGEVSAPHAQSSGMLACNHRPLGTPQLFGETDDSVNRKTQGRVTLDCIPSFAWAKCWRTRSWTYRGRFAPAVWQLLSARSAETPQRR